MPESRTLAEVLSALRSCRYSFSEETELQAGVAQALAAAGIEGFEREVTLCRGVRLDLFDAASGIAIECKIKGTPQQLARQVLGYLARPEIRTVVIVCRPALGRYAEACAPDRVAVVEVGGIA